MRHGKKYSGGYDYKAIREYETRIEKQNEIKRALEPNKLWITMTVIVFISLCLVTLISVKIYSAWFESKLRSEVTMYVNIRAAIGNYLVHNGYEPDRDSANIYADSGKIIQTMVSSGRLEYEDFYSPTLQRSVIFRDCNNVLMGRLCVGLAQEMGEVTPLDVHAWPPKNMPSISAVPIRFACVAEVLHDDKNYYDGSGISKGSSGLTLPKACSEESMKLDLTGEFDYIFAVGKL
jgi:hypothetical protein